MRDLLQPSARHLTVCVTLLLLMSCAPVHRPAPLPADLALRKPASSSSIENDDHNAAAANDGDPSTFWISDDEPEGVADWWQVDLLRPATVSACKIIFPYTDKNYRFRIEGSMDSNAWVLLSDQSQTTDRSQVRYLKLNGANVVRFVRITVTGFDEGCWPSLSEVKIFGVETRSGFQP